MQIRYYTDSLKSFGLKNADFTYYPRENVDG